MSALLEGSVYYPDGSDPGALLSEIREISYTDLLGDATLIGPGAGRKETGYALVFNLLFIYRQH